MTTFWRFLYYRLKSSALRTVIFTVLSTAICLLGIYMENKSDNVEFCQSGLYMLATALCIIANIVPLFELAGLKNRRNLDTLYFFPIGRKKMATVYFLSGWMQVVFIYTVTFIASLIWLISQTDYFALIYMLPYYFLSLVLAFVIFAVFSFLFLQANTVADGVLFCVLWIFLPFLAGLTLGEVFEIDFFRNLYSWGILYTPMNNLTVVFQDLIEINNPASWDRAAGEIMDRWYVFFIWGAAGCAAVNGYMVSFIKKGAEQAGEISNSPFGYAMLVPFYGYCFMINAGAFLVSLDPIVALIVIVGYVILMLSGYLIYRRGFHFKASDIILTVIGVILPFAVMIYTNPA